MSPSAGEGVSLGFVPSSGIMVSQDTHTFSRISMCQSPRHLKFKKLKMEFFIPLSSYRNLFFPFSCLNTKCYHLTSPS